MLSQCSPQWPPSSSGEYTKLNLRSSMGAISHFTMEACADVECAGGSGGSRLRMTHRISYLAMASVAQSWLLVLTENESVVMCMWPARAKSAGLGGV